MSLYSPVSVFRVSGARNTFFVINLFHPESLNKFSQMSDFDKRELARKLCQRYYGFHTDGLLFLKPETEHDFSWEFFNSDGSTAEMCGNAARCAVLFFHEQVRPQKEIHFKTSAGDITGEFLASNLIRVQMTKIFAIKTQTVLGLTGFYVNTGVPHFVLEQDPSAELAKKLRLVPDFGPPGANITFVQDLRSGEIAEGKITAVTFERGVENFTQACGTGAVAAALYLQHKQGPQRSVNVQMPGGILKVEKLIENQRPLLTGEAQIEFEMTPWEKK